MQNQQILSPQSYASLWKSTSPLGFQTPSGWLTHAPQSPLPPASRPRWAARDPGLSGRELSLCFASGPASQDVLSSREAERDGRGGSPARKVHMASAGWTITSPMYFLCEGRSHDTIFNRCSPAIFIATAGNVLNHTQVSLKASPNRKSESKS